MPRNWEFGNDLANLRLPGYQRLSALAVAAAVLLGSSILLAASIRGDLTPDELPLAMAAMVTLALAASPVAWTHYQVMQYPGMAMLLYYTRKRRQWVPGGCALLAGLCSIPCRWRFSRPITGGTSGQPRRPRHSTSGPRWHRSHVWRCSGCSCVKSKLSGRWQAKRRRRVAPGHPYAYLQTNAKHLLCGWEAAEIRRAVAGHANAVGVFVFLFFAHMGYDMTVYFLIALCFVLGRAMELALAPAWNRARRAG